MIYRIDDLFYRYGTGSSDVLRGASLTVDEGELVTVLGKNGAGKSTLFACMLGLLKPRSGEITLCGRALHAMSERDIAKITAFVPQNNDSTFDYSVFDYVLMGCAARVGLFSHPGKAEESRALSALERMGIASLAQRRFTELSGGERQQVTIARAIAAEPKMILFDEPTSHLDMANQIKVLRIIKSLSEEGYAVAVTTHDPNHALLLGGKTAILGSDGRLRTGRTSELIDEALLRQVYGTELCLRYLEEFDREVCIYPNL